MNFFALAPTSGRAGRQMSRTGRRNMATLKPTTPLHAPNTEPLKPTTPLRPKTVPKTLISHPQRRRRFQPHTGTSEQRRQWFHTTGPPGRQGQAAVPAGDDDTTASQISHAIRLEEVSTISENVAIPTLLIHDSKEPRGNCMRNCWLTAIAGFQGDISSRRSAPRHHWHGGHRR